MRELLLESLPVTVAVFGLGAYFLGMAVMFMTKPVKRAAMFAIKPNGPAGVTEIRVYYGAISLALASFLLFLFFRGHGELALIGGLFFSNIVLVSRTIFTFVDKAWKEKYTKLAIPAESVFIALLWLMFALNRVL